ncbi:MAG TPA: DegV family protein [Dehalococcoidia bacterium]|nr:DegV family protein [Dehalococcoidia bacterium]
MAIRIVTDSTADLPKQLVEELGITVVPVYLRFGEEVYLDRVDISEDEFYRRLEKTTVHPSTVQPGPQDFLEVYRKLSPKADGIVSIHVSAKLSGTCNSALMAKDMLDTKCPVEVVDSQMVTMGLGLLVIAAATAAKKGESLDKIVKEVKKTIPKIHVLCLFDTLKYLLLGGRIGKAKALLGSILSVKPMITLKDGEIVPAGQVRTRAKGIDKLLEFGQNAKNIQDLAVVHSTTPDEAQNLAKQLGPTFDRKRIRMSRVGPALGVHTGPGALIVAIREG